MGSDVTATLNMQKTFTDQANKFARNVSGIPADARQSLVDRTPKACFGSFDDCLRAVCGQDVPGKHFYQHRMPLQEALRPHVNLFGSWEATKGPIVYYVLRKLKNSLCPGPLAPAPVAVAAAASVPVPAPKPAATCLPTATARMNPWTILGEMALGGLFLYLFRGKIPQFNTASGVGGTSPYGDLPHSDLGI